MISSNVLFIVSQVSARWSMTFKRTKGGRRDKKSGTLILLFFPIMLMVFLLPTWRIKHIQNKISEEYIYRS